MLMLKLNNFMWGNRYLKIIWSPNYYQYFQSSYFPSISSYDYSLVILSAPKMAL